MRLDRTGRDHDAARVDEVEKVVGVHGNERALVDPGRNRVLEQRDARVDRDLGSKLEHALERLRRGDPLPDLPFVADQHALTRPRRGERGGEAGHAGSDHEQVGMLVQLLALRRRPRQIDRPEPRDAPDDPLDVGPRPAGRRNVL